MNWYTPSSLVPVVANGLTITSTWATLSTAFNTLTLNSCLNSPNVTVTV